MDIFGGEGAGDGREPTAGGVGRVDERGRCDAGRRDSQSPSGSVSGGGGLWLGGEDLLATACVQQAFLVPDTLQAARDAWIKECREVRVPWCVRHVLEFVAGSGALPGERQIFIPICRAEQFDQLFQATTHPDLVEWGEKK